MNDKDERNRQGVFKRAFAALVIVLCLGLHTASAASGIPDRLGVWRIEVHPAGNEFYDPSAPEKVNGPSAGDKTDPPKQPDEPLSRYRARFDVAAQIAGLRRGAKQAREGFRYVVIGDTRSNWPLWSSMVKHIDAIFPQPAFVIHVGDAVENGYAEQYRDYYIPPLLRTDIPFFMAIGNHDDGSGSKAREYRSIFGERALNYYFDFGQARFVFVDSATKVQRYEDTLRWLDQTLSATPKGYGKYVAIHKPPKVIEKWSYHAWGSKESKAFTDVMQKHNVSEVYAGHIHAYSTARYHGVNYTICGGGGAPLHGRFGPLGSAYHYLICDVMPNGTVRQQVVQFHRAR